MAITKAEKAAYNDYIKEPKVKIDEIKKKIRELETKKNKKPRIAGYINLEVVVEYLKSIMISIEMSDASMEILHIKNERFLDNARKDIYKVIQIMEDLVGADVDRSLKENEDYIQKIERANPPHILKIINAIFKAFNILVNRMGEGSKWKWSFVDLYGRIAIITKNIINFSEIQKYRDPRSDYYKERQDLLRLCKELLSESGKQYRDKYELSTKVPSDILKAIGLLSALRKINILFGDAEEASRLKKNIESLRARMEADEKKGEKKKKEK